MTSPEIDYGPFERAIASLAEGIAQVQAFPDDDLRRDGVIQRFEYTYELSWKMLKRHLESVAPDPDRYDGFSFRQLIRAGAERGLLRSGLEEWTSFRRARSITSHVYDREKAMEVFAAIPGFLAEASFLLERMKTEAAE